MPTQASGVPTVLSNSFVTLHYRIRLHGNADATLGAVVVSTFEDKPATLQMGLGQLAEGLERCLLGMHVGQRDTFVLPPEKAYGLPKPELFRPVSKSLLASHAEEGTRFEAGDFVHFPAPDGGQFAGTVVEDLEDSILFDFNHPLAGKHLQFEVQLIGVL